MKTFWLIMANNRSDAVRLENNASDLDVKCKALAELDVMPCLAYPDIPSSYRNMIHHAKIVTFDNES
jgi:hypothetical protein